MVNFWLFVGVALFAWVGWDLYHGYTLLYDVIYKEQDPTMFWVAIAAWSGLALSCFFAQEEEE